MSSFDAVVGHFWSQLARSLWKGSLRDFSVMIWESSLGPGRFSKDWAVTARYAQKSKRTQARFPSHLVESRRRLLLSFANQTAQSNDLEPAAPPTTHDNCGGSAPRASTPHRPSSDPSLSASPLSIAYSTSTYSQRFTRLPCALKLPDDLQACIPECARGPSPKG
jgi:hypothetical protein